MKTFILPVIIFITLLAPCYAPAELVIYKGGERETLSGDSNDQHTTWHVFVIVDHDTGNFARIRYASVNGSKIHRTLIHTNSHIVQVIGSNAQTYTAITRIPTDCDSQEFPGSESVYFEGRNAPLVISSDSTVFFPKILTDTGVGLSHSTNAAPILGAGTFVLAFNKPQTLASNTAGETLDAAFSRLVDYVRSLGY